MELVLFEEGNNGNEEEEFASKSNATSDMLQKDDTNLEAEACDHFSIREYVANCSERDPHSCSPFESDKLTWGPLPPVPPKKFRRWDCNSCVSKVISTDTTGNDSDESANNNNNNNRDTTCSISFLGTTLVPLSVGAPSSLNGSSSKKKDTKCATTTGGCHLHATPSAASPDTSDNEPLSSLIKSDKLRVVQEQERTKTHNELEKCKEIHEIMAATCRNDDLPESPVAGKISKVNGKKARKVRSLAEIIGNGKSAPPHDDGMDEDLTLVKENTASEVACKSGLIIAKSKKKYKTLEVVDESSYLKCWLKRSKKLTSHDKCAKITKLEGKSVIIPSSIDQESDKKKSVIGNFVRKKRTKIPRRFVRDSATGGEIACKKSCHKPLELTGNREAHSKKELLKIVSQKRKMENSKPEFGARKIRKKKQKISEKKISNDIPMDIVELLAKSLREKHLTDDADSNSNSNSNSRDLPQEKLPPNRMLINFSRAKSAFNKTSEALKLHRQSSNSNPDYGYTKQFPNYGSLIQQPGTERCMNWNCTQLQFNANLVVPRNEIIPATHLLQLMDASTSSSSPYNQPLLVPNCFQKNLHQSPHKLFRPLPRLGVFGSQLQKEITSPTSNCGTQSGYRIGNGPTIPTEGICVINRNPADFITVDENNNEYMIDGREIKPITEQGRYGNFGGIVYRSSGILYNGVVNLKCGVSSPRL